MKKGTKITEKLKADVMQDIVPDADKIAEKYNERQIDLLFAFVRCIKLGVLK